MNSETDRQLAAIMFTDIVGYTALMQSDEEKAIRFRAKHRKIFEEEHARFGGRIVQYYGDGTLSVFSSAVKACECAVQIQRSMQSGEPVPLRIGLHQGDIVIDKTEVYGDAVNLASRIESLAIAGSVLISSSVNTELENKESIKTHSLGSFAFKNVADKMEVFAIAEKDLNCPVPSDLNPSKGSSLKSLAVLPFVNMSTQKENEFFSDGITEEIINALSKIKNLKVTSRTSSFYFKDKALPIKKIAKELGVTAILEGSVRLAGDAVRITAQLIQAEDDFHFWSETWDRKLENIFETQDEISLLIAERLREQYGHFEIQEKLVEKKTSNYTAYELLLKGKYHRAKWNPADVKKAIEFFEQVVILDPDIAETYTELADCYSFLGTTGFLPYEEAWMKSHGYTLTAFELDEKLPGVHHQLSNEAFFIHGDYPKALREMKIALDLDPNNAKAHEFLSFLYIVKGDVKKAKEHLDTALSINPMSEETQFFKGYHYYMIGEFGDAIRILDRCLEVNDKNIPAHSIKTNCLLLMERYDEAIMYHEGIPQEVIIPEEEYGTKLLAYALKGDRKEAEMYLEQIKAQTKGQNALTAHSFILFHKVMTRALDEAFVLLEDSIEQKSYVPALRFCDPMLASLKADPRYETMRERLYKSEEEPAPSKKKPLLDEAKKESYLKKLLSHLREERPYLNSELSLRSLAEEVGIPANQLSWLINAGLGKNFNDFINHYRIETFKELALDPSNAGITIMGLAYDSGFNSKTTFNSSFKKEVGLSPKQFLKEQS